jgi:bifunctional non-homologous end joining protein LigD
VRAKRVTTIEGARAETITGESFPPELCRSQQEPPRGEDWLHETKWDGYRIVVAVANGKVRLWSRNAIEWTHKVPELAAAIETLRFKSAQLDGEMVVLRNGRDNFNALQSPLSAVTKESAVYVLFDLIHLNGQSLRTNNILDGEGGRALDSCEMVRRSFRCRLSCCSMVIHQEFWWPNCAFSCWFG